MDYVFICMEPSLRGWARDPDEAKAKIDTGISQFYFSGSRNIVLTFCNFQVACANSPKPTTSPTFLRALCSSNMQGWSERHAMIGGNSLLLEELDLVARANANIFAVGRIVDKFLQARAVPRSPQQSHRVF